MPPPVLPRGTLCKTPSAFSSLVKAFDPEEKFVKNAKEIPKHRVSLSQGQTPECVGFGTANLLNVDALGPFYNLPKEFAHKLYAWTRDHDSWPDNDGDPLAGTEPWKALKGLQKLGIIEGHIKGYYTEKTLREAVLTIGPCGFATAWYEGMDHPNPNGIIRRTGAYRGDHWWVFLGFDQKTNDYICFQSWGGYAPFDVFGQVVRLPAGDVRTLINKDGGYGLQFIKAKPRIPLEKAMML